MGEHVFKLLQDWISEIQKRPSKAGSGIAKLVEQTARRGARAQTMNNLTTFANRLSASLEAAPRERAYNSLRRFMVLEFLFSVIVELKKGTVALDAFQLTPSELTLRLLGPLQQSIADVEASLRALSAIDDIDSSLVTALALHASRIAKETLDANMNLAEVPTELRKNRDDIDALIAYAERLVAINVLLKLTRRYSAATGEFNLKEVFGAIASDLTIANLQSIGRRKELRALFAREGDRRPVEAHYQTLNRRLKAEQ